MPFLPASLLCVNVHQSLFADAYYLARERACMRAMTSIGTIWPVFWTFPASWTCRPAMRWRLSASWRAAKTCCPFTRNMPSHRRGMSRRLHPFPPFEQGFVIVIVEVGVDVGEVPFHTRCFAEGIERAVDVVETVMCGDAEGQVALVLAVQRAAQLFLHCTFELVDRGLFQFIGIDLDAEVATALQDFGGSQRIGNADDVATRQVQGQAGRGQQFVNVLVDLARGQRFIHGACFVFACQHADVGQSFAIDVVHRIFQSKTY